MKTIITALAAFAFLFSTQQTKAGIKIPFGKRQVLNKVADLPDSDAYKISASGEYMDLGTLHEEFNIAWIMPLQITQEPKLVGISKDEKTYYDLTDEQADRIIAENKLDKDKLLSLGFYTKYGGKIVAFLLAALIILGIVSPSKKEKVKPEIV